MARYIDADALLLKKETIELPDPNGGEYHIDIIHSYDVERAPTADVVPKSEVEELKTFIKIYKKYNKAIRHERVEVSREIFEEIDVLVDDWKHSRIQSIQFIAELAELKKKYTGGEK